jgi:hypothetical protein
MDVPDLTSAEIYRRFEDHDRRLDLKVNRELYDRDRANLSDDVKDIRERIDQLVAANTWAMRLIAGQFVALIVGLIMFLVGRP